MSRPLTPIADRFWLKVRQSDGCWEWIGWRMRQGYGVLSRSGSRGSLKRVLAHRLSWEIHNGPIPDGLFVCHHCDNPPCVRPDHLFLGTNADNMADLASKNLSRRGTLAPDVVRAIRAAQGPIRAIGQRFGVPFSNVSRIRRGELYRWVA